MFVHSLYNDVLLSIRSLINNYVLQDERIIKKFEYAIANRTFQFDKDYHTQFAFPNCFISITDTGYPTFGSMHQLFKVMPTDNINQTPVLYNVTNDHYLCIQEESKTIGLNVVINCESALQAIEIENMFKSLMHIGKYCSPFVFTSFLEVPLTFLNAAEFHPNLHNITNLFTKLNPKTGDIVNCFSVEYQPLIRVDSINSTITDSTQQSFPVTMDFVYIIPFPIYLYSNKIPGLIEKIHIHLSYAFEAISDKPMTKLIDYQSENYLDLKRGYSVRNYIVHYNQIDYTTSTSDIENYSLTLLVAQDHIESDDKVLIVDRLSGNKLKIKYDGTVYYISNICDNGEIIDLETQGYITIEPNANCDLLIKKYTTYTSVYIQFEPDDLVITDDYQYNLFIGDTFTADYLNYTIDDTENSITFKFTEEDWPSYQPTITSPLIVQFYLPDDIPDEVIYGIPPEDPFDINVIDITQTNSVILWSTTALSSTRVDYGTSTDYGSFVYIDELVNSHRVFIQGLTADTEYHYQVSGSDEDDAEIVSEDQTFTTLT